METTLDKIRKHRPCESSWVELLESLGKTEADDAPLAMEYILDTLGVVDCLWAARVFPDHGKMWRLLACDFAAKALPIFEKRRPDDPRVRNCIEIARKYINGEVSADDLLEARRAAAAAAYAAYAAATYAADAAYATDAAATYAADAAATYAAAAAAAYAADAAAAAAAYAAAAAADADARKEMTAWQTERIRACLRAGEYVKESDGE